MKTDINFGDDANELCEFCGEPRELDLFEIYREDRAFQFSTCCETVYDLAIDELQGGTRAPWIRELFAAYGLPIRQVYDDYMSLKLDYGLELREIDQKTAKAFVLKHHRHNKPPAGWKWGHALYNGHELIAVAFVGRPVARKIDAATTVEVTRVCVDPSLDRALVWNACSMLYGAARKEAKRRAKAKGYRTIITYTLESEDATSIKAAGWTPAAVTRGGSWDRVARPRKDTAPTCPKVRWEARLAA